MSICRVYSSAKLSGPALKDLNLANYGRILTLIPGITSKSIEVKKMLKSIRDSYLIHVNTEVEEVLIFGGDRLTVEAAGLAC